MKEIFKAILKYLFANTKLDEKVADVPFYRPAEDSPEIQYMHARRKALGGFLPKRREEADETLTLPSISIFESLLTGTKDRKISTTMAFVRLLTALCKDKEIGKRIVPIVPDEARTFGMEGLFRQVGIYNPLGQQYRPVDSDQVMVYKESTDGQILQEGINEALQIFARRFDLSLTEQQIQQASFYRDWETR